MTETLRKAQATRVLGGAAIRTIGLTGAMFLLGVQIGLAALALTALGLPASLVLAGSSAALVLELLLLRRWIWGATRRNNDAVEALSLGQLDRAEAGFLSVVVRRYPYRWTALGLQNLAVVAIRKGEIADAVALGRAALDIELARKRGPAAQVFSGHIRANYAFALVCNGELDEADAVLAPPIEEGALPMSAALLARSRALCAIRRERHEEALAILESERRLLRNVLAGSEAALAEAMEAFATVQLGRPAGKVAVDDDQRAYVLRALPGADGVLVRG